MPAQIPRILYHLPSKNPLILSLNKYYLSRIILEIPLQLSHENYFPELLNPHLTILTYYVIIYYGNRYRLAQGPIYWGQRPIYLASNMLYIPFGASLGTNPNPSIVLQCKNKPKIAFKMPTYQITHGTY